jgi:hypothetical protein
MKKQWNKYFSIIIAGVLAAIIISILVIILGNRNTTTHGIPIPTPSYSNPGTNTTTAASPVPTAMMNKPGNKPVLSENDTFAEDQILSFLPDGQASGIVYDSNIVRVYYDSNSDKFLAEILTEDIAGAKSEAVSWFESQGMSQQGICNSPVIFYLSPEVSQLYKIQRQTIKFNPLPDGCT